MAGGATTTSIGWFVSRRDRDEGKENTSIGVELGGIEVVDYALDVGDCAVRLEVTTNEEFTGLVMVDGG
jgi:hypothetical protein